MTGNDAEFVKAIKNIDQDWYKRCTQTKMLTLPASYQYESGEVVSHREVCWAQC